MKKMKFLIVVAVMLCCLALSGCGGGDAGGEPGGQEDGASIDSSALAQRLSEEVAFEDQLTQVEEGMALALYGLTSDQVASVAVYVGTGATAEEIAVIEGTDKSGADVIKAQVEGRVASQLADYGDYKPEEVPKLENPVLKTHGNFVILCVSGDNETAESIIEEITK